MRDHDGIIQVIGRRNGMIGLHPMGEGGKQEASLCATQLRVSAPPCELTHTPTIGSHTETQRHGEKSWM